MKSRNLIKSINYTFNLLRLGYQEEEKVTIVIVYCSNFRKYSRTISNDTATPFLRYCRPLRFSLACWQQTGDSQSKTLWNRFTRLEWQHATEFHVFSFFP